MPTKTNAEYDAETIARDIEWRRDRKIRDLTSEVQRLRRAIEIIVEEAYVPPGDYGGSLFSRGDVAKRIRDLLTDTPPPSPR